jgi:hypothetical protein
MSNEPQKLSKEEYFDQNKMTFTGMNGGDYLDKDTFLAYAPQFESEIQRLKEDNERLKGLIIKAVQYGFGYALNSQNDGKAVPTGNILQWLQSQQLEQSNVPRWVKAEELEKLLLSLLEEYNLEYRTWDGDADYEWTKESAKEISKSIIKWLEEPKEELPKPLPTPEERDTRQKAKP